MYPPQIIRGLPWTLKSDVWSLGTVFYDVIHGYEQYLKFNRKRQEWKMNPPPTNPLLREILEKTLQDDPEKRCDWDELFRLANCLDWNGDM